MTEATNATHAAAQAPPQPIQDDTEIAEAVRAKGLLVSVTFTQWSGRRLDRRVTDETNSRAGADSDAGRYNKHLLGGKVKSFDAVTAKTTAIRVWADSETLPWSDNASSGSRLLSAGNYFPFVQRFKRERDEWRQLCEVFFVEYPQLVQLAERRLGSMYRPDDYPTVAELRAKFSCRISFSPIPAAADLRVDLPPEVIQHMRRSIEARVTRSVDAAVRDGWDRLYASVERIRDRLREIAAADPDGKQARLHASLFSGAVETAETLRRLNVLDDPQLDSMAGRIIAELGALEPKELRKDPEAMTQTADAADGILSAMAGIYGRGAS